MALIDQDDHARDFFRNPYFWGTCLGLSFSVMVIGWAHTFPMLFSPIEFPTLQAISPLFWIGLGLGFLSLVGLVLAASSPVAHWASALLFVVLYSAPHWLYLAWGSDAGALANMMRYSQAQATFDLPRDTAVNSYFQWPVSIFFGRFLADSLQLDVYTTAQLIFSLICFCVAGVLFTFFYEPVAHAPHASASAFWSVVLYFIGFYWVFNWQSAPYTFFLALFLPAVAISEKRSVGYKLLLLLLVTVGMETHALFGVWFILLMLLFLITQAIWQRNRQLYSLVLFAAVVQISLIIYKNFRFFRYLVLSLQGYYDALLVTSASDRALLAQTRSALETSPTDWLGSILKGLSFVDLGLVGIVFLVAFIWAIANRRIRLREGVYFVAGLAYFLIGTAYAAIGTRSLQLLALVPAAFAADSFTHMIARRKVLLALGAISLVLFVGVLMRGHQSGGNYVKPSDLTVRDFVSRYVSDLSRALIFSDGIRPVDLRINAQLYSPTTFLNLPTCRGDYLLIETQYLRFRVQARSKELLSQMDGLPTLRFYDDGYAVMKAGTNCDQLYSLWDKTR